MADRCAIKVAFVYAVDLQDDKKLVGDGTPLLLALPELLGETFTTAQSRLLRVMKR